MNAQVDPEIEKMQSERIKDMRRSTQKIKKMQKKENERHV